jgi:hypothetical protein
MHRRAASATAASSSPQRATSPFKKGARWGGAVSLWINTDVDKLLQTKFCDPIQITHKGANNGGLWFDFNDAKPRDLRHGAFPAVAEGQTPIKEEDPKAPMVRVPRVGLKQGDWHHIVLSWRNFDTGKDDAVSALYIDGKLVGEVKDRALAMDWDIEKAGIYVAINYIGLLDELAVFGRELSADEVARLHKEPALLATPKKNANLPVPPAFPFDAATAARYQREVAAALGLPVEFTDAHGIAFVLVPPGQFLMGSPTDEPGRNADEAQHTATLTRPFYVGKHEVTVGQFRRFIEKTKYVTDGEKNGGGHAHDARAV